MRPGSAASRLSLLAAALLCVALLDAAQAGSYVVRCPAAGSSDERFAITAIAPTEPGCVGRALPTEAESVLAVLPAPRRAANSSEPEVLTVSGATGKSGFEVREVITEPPARPALAPYLVPGVDIRAVSSVGALGPLGRTTLDTSGDDTVLDCAPGSEAAGLSFSTARMPPIPGMSLRVVHSSDQNFHLVVTIAGASTPRQPRPLSKLREAESATEAHVPLPADLPADTPIDIEVLCPAAGGHLALSEIVLEANTKVPASRAGWVRDARRWQENAADVFTRAQRWSMTKLYVRVPLAVSGVADPQALAGFVAEATSRGIEVWALLSDSTGADGERVPLAAAGAALADYNAGVSGEAQIKGTVVEYAPDRLWRYVADPAAEAQAFLDRLQVLKPALGMPLSAAVPWWFPTDSSVAERWASTLDGMTVIADKTDPTDIRRSVARFLSWGTRRGRPVEVALEAVPLDDGERGRFLRAESGELWLITVGDGNALVLFKEPASGLPGLAFQQEEVVPVPATSRSFAGQGPELREALGPLGRALGAWPSFAGFAFHGLLGGPR